MLHTDKLDRSSVIAAVGVVDWYLAVTLVFQRDDRFGPVMGCNGPRTRTPGPVRKSSGSNRGSGPDRGSTSMTLLHYMLHPNG
jgi:hypothetical protein